jgi:predicted nucleic acid-binding protein
MIYILDCSFCVSVFLPNEKSEQVLHDFYKIEETDEVYIPSLWWYEVSNVLTVAVRRNRLKHNDVLNIIQLLNSYKFITDSIYGNDYAEKLFEFSQLYELSAYDSAYLELAIRKNGKIGTIDEKLKSACIQAGIQLV